MTKAQSIIKHIKESIKRDFISLDGTWHYSTLSQLLQNSKKFNRSTTFSFIEEFIELIKVNHTPKCMYKASQLLYLMKEKEFPFFSIAIQSNVHSIAPFYAYESNDALMTAACELFSKIFVGIKPEQFKQLVAKTPTKRSRNLSAEKKKHAKFAQPIRTCGAKRRIVCYSPQPYILI